MISKPEDILEDIWQHYQVTGKDRTSFYDLTLSIIGWQLLQQDYTKQRNTISNKHCSIYNIHVVYHALIQTQNNKPLLRALDYWQYMLHNRLSGKFSPGLLTTDMEAVQNIPTEVLINILGKWYAYSNNIRVPRENFIKLLDHIEQELSTYPYGESLFHTPRELAQLMVNYVDRHPHPLTIYDPFARSANFLGTALEELHEIKQVQGNVTTELVSKLTILRLLNTSNSEMNVELGSNIRTAYQAPKQFDIILSNPPYGEKYNYAAPLQVHNKTLASLVQKTKRLDVLFLGHILDSLSDKGHAAVLLPAIFISGNSLGKEIIVELVKQNVLDMVIELPEGLFLHTNIAPVLFCLSKTRTEKQPVWLIDATTQAQKQTRQAKFNLETVRDWFDRIKKEDTKDIKEISAVSAADIAANDYNLHRMLHSNSEDSGFQVTRKKSTIIYQQCLQLEQDVDKVRKKLKALIKNPV